MTDQRITSGEIVAQKAVYPNELYLVSDDMMRRYFPSRRERIATAAMQGLLAFSHPEYDMGGVEEVVKDAVKAADALIAELDKESK